MERQRDTKSPFNPMTIRRLRANFERKLKEVRGLTDSIQNAVDAKEATWIDGKILASHELSYTWHKYDSFTNDLRKRLEQGDLVDNSEEIDMDTIDQTLSKASDSYLQTKTDVMGLFRELRKQTHTTGNGSSSSSSSSSDEVENVKTEADKENLDNEEASENGEKEEDQPEENMLRKHAKTVLLGIVTIMLVYFGLYLIINEAEKNKRLQTEG